MADTAHSSKRIIMARHFSRSPSPESFLQTFVYELPCADHLSLAHAVPLDLMKGGQGRLAIVVPLSLVWSCLLIQPPVVGRAASAHSHGAIMTAAVALNALRYRPTQLRRRVSILRGPVSHADDQLGVSRERYLREERRSR
jgi:hypothetical protein